VITQGGVGTTIECSVTVTVTVTWVLRHSSRFTDKGGFVFLRPFSLWLSFNEEVRYKSASASSSVPRCS